MKQFNDFTLVIQGPLHKNGLYAIVEYYRHYTDNIILSYWNTDDEKLKQYAVQLSKNYGIKLVENDFYKTMFFNNQNVYYQVYTTRNGLLDFCTSEFTIKMRCDQIYGNLIPMFESIRNNPDNYNCVNLHFRPDNLYKFHPSDKMIGCNTKLLKRAFNIAFYRIVKEGILLVAGVYNYTEYDDIDIKLFIDKNKFDYFDTYNFSDVNRKMVTNYGEKPLIGTAMMLPSGYIGIVPEVLIGTSFLMAKGILPEWNKSKEQMKENFNIVRVEDMLPYINKDGENVIEHNWVEINNLGEL